VNIGEVAIVRHSIIRDSRIDAGATILEVVLYQSLVSKDVFVRENLRRSNVGDALRIDFGDIWQ
jgi:hypothetical protein